MERSDKYEGILQNIFSPCDAFSAAQSAMLVLLLVPYCMTHGGFTVLPFLPLAALAAFAVLPLVYTLLHRFDTLLFGRYHLVMPLSALLAAPFFVLIFSADTPSASSACKVFFGVLFYSLFVLIYKYCAFSVRARLYGEDVSRPRKSAMWFITAGLLSAVATVVGFRFYDPDTAFINSAYVIQSASVILAVAQYLTTFYGIPKLGGRRVQSVKSVFRAFYSGVKTKTYFCSLLFLSACAVQAALVIYCAVCSGVPSLYAVIAGGALCVAFCCARQLFLRVKPKRIAFSVSGFVCLVVSGALAVVAVLVNLNEAARASLFVISAVLSGAGGAAAFSIMRADFISVKSRVTSGIVYGLINLTAYAAVAIALAVAAVICGLSRYGNSELRGARRRGVRAVVRRKDERQDAARALVRAQDGGARQDRRERRKRKRYYSRQR